MARWEVEIDHGVAVITCVQPEEGTLSFDAVSELADVLDKAGDTRDEASIVMITGRDGAFVPAVDRDELRRRSEGELVSGDDLAWHRVTKALESMPQPTVAAIDGNATSGGMLIALACSFRIAGERSTFGPVEINLGVVGTDSSANLVRLVGPGTALELLLTGRAVEAATAKQIGLVNDVLPGRKFAASAREWARRLAALPPVSVFAIKHAVDAKAR